jgi:P4 family phage/plasmid primase-like protien
LSVIQEIIALFTNIIREYLDINKEIKVFLLEKPPRLHDKQKGIYKDGFHLVFPEIVTKADFQYFLRDNTIAAIGELLEPLRYLNLVDDIYDKAAVKNNWFLYGSNKPTEKDKWKLTHIFIIDETGSFTEDSLNYYNLDTLVDILSIRNKYDETPYLPGKSLIKPKSLPIVPEQPTTVDSVDSISTCSILGHQSVEHEYIRDLLNILSPNRYDNYDAWIRVGWCLYNIEPSNNMLNEWIKFSKKSKKFVLGECEKIWFRMTINKDGLRLGTLCLWAKQDDFSKYKEVTSKSVKNLILKSQSGTHTEVARVIHRCYGETFMCGSIKNNLWYEYKNHRWVMIEIAYSLRQVISNQIVNMYSDQVKSLKMLAMTFDCDDEQKRILAQATKIGKVGSKLMTTSFKDGLMKECSEMFYDPDFNEKLDTNQKLLGFTNGVYDLSKHTFRAGDPKDFLTMTTDYDFVSEDDSEIMDDILNFINSIMLNDNMKEYLLKVLSYMLDGNKYLEELWFFTGRGRNGKGTLCNLLKVAMGDYYYEPDITIVTAIKKSSSSPTPDLVKAKGKRIFVSSEPDDEDKDSKFRVNRLKQLRGNDLIQARDLYKGCIEFVPQFGMIFQMNEKPELSKVDDAIGRSLRIIEFPYQFVAIPQHDYQKKIDTELKEKFKDLRYRQQFMRILLKYHKNHIVGNNTFDVPGEVESCTKEYLEENNPVSIWFYDNYDITGRQEDRIPTKDVYRGYSTSYPKQVVLTDKKFGYYMSLLGYRSRVFNSIRYYIGFKEKPQNEDIE